VRPSKREIVKLLTCQFGGCAHCGLCGESRAPGFPGRGGSTQRRPTLNIPERHKKRYDCGTGGIFGSARTTQVHSASRRGGYAKIRSTLSRHDDVEGTVSFRRRCRRHCRIAVRAHLVRLLLLERVSDLLLPMLDLCMQARARARRSACSRTSGRRQSSRLHGLEPHIIALW